MNNASSCDGIETRTIWFWQVPRYLDDGWTINRTGFASHWSFWLDVIEDAIAPCACRSVRRRPDIFSSPPTSPDTEETEHAEARS